MRIIKIPNVRKVTVYISDLNRERRKTEQIKLKTSFLTQYCGLQITLLFWVKAFDCTDKTTES